MRRFRRAAHKSAILVASACASLLSWTALGADNLEDTNAANRSKNLARLNCGAHIDRVLPGGNVQAVPISTDGSDNPSSLVLDDNTISCPLPVGDNTFIITLPRIAVLQRFAFINQNAAAQGEFELAVSNYRLGSRDPKWITVQSGAPF